MMKKLWFELSVQGLRILNKAPSVRKSDEETTPGAKTILTWNFAHIKASIRLACQQSSRIFGQPTSEIWIFQDIYA